jgi:A nuclease family of the HNH/ENDO VII superfamily with conserved AHH
VQRLRTERERLGFNLNDLANGVMLPSAKADQNAMGGYHPRLDNDLYNDTVVNELLGVT